jgi:hypothetical protein
VDAYMLALPLLIDPGAGRDLDDAVVLIAKGRIVAVGRRDTPACPLG